MAEPGVWPSIRRHGLLSTSALLDLFSIDGDLRYDLESRHRPRSVPIKHLKLGTAMIRDQGPMAESALRKCLRGLTPRQWYELLNRRVFFWVTEERVQNLLGARRYRGKEHTVITVDTSSVLRCHSDRITLSPINSGSTLYNPQPRGRQTFLPLDEYPFGERRRMRGIANAIAELAVDYSVPDISEHAIRVEHRRGQRVVEILYERRRSNS
jgi:hypothetical protein